MNDWEAIRAEVGRLMASTERKLPTEVIRRTAGLIEFGSACCDPPTSIDFGYRDTVCLSWSTARPVPIGIEVSDTDFEFYAFADGQTDIRHFAYKGEAVIPDILAQILKGRIGRS